MPIELTGHDLDRDGLVRAARLGTRVRLGADARTAMIRTHEVAMAALARGDAVYGASTGVGFLKRIALAPDVRDRYSSTMLGQHLVGHGEPVPRDVLRATLVRLANHLAEGSPGARPELADRLLEALEGDELPVVPSIGSVGQGDLAPLATLVLPIVADFGLAAGEGTALLANNAFATAWAALAVADAADLVDLLDVAGAVSLDGFAANPTLLHSRIADVRPYPGLRRSLLRLNELLRGSAIHDPGIARNLQDPLSFRNLPQLQGAARDALDHVDRVLAIELNASQGNPIVVEDEGRVVSVANFEILPLAAALDYLRIVLASVLGAASERVTKLLYPVWSALPTGLTPEPGTAEAGLTYLSLAAQSLAMEARLLAQPVSFELVSTSHAEGVEDRTTSAPLAARRLAEQVQLGARIAAVELAVASQAVEVRGLRPGAGTAAAIAIVRRHVPFLAMGEHVADLEPLVVAIREGAFGELIDNERTRPDEPTTGDDDGDRA